MLIFRRTIVLEQHLVSSPSVGDCSDHRLREDSKNLCIKLVKNTITKDLLFARTRRSVFVNSFLVHVIWLWRGSTGLFSQLCADACSAYLVCRECIAIGLWGDKHCDCPFLTCVDARGRVKPVHITFMSNFSTFFLIALIVFHEHWC